MENVYKKIEQFLKEKQYKKRKDILGIILYGSVCNNIADNNSDIDLMIITLGKTYTRGAYTVENTTIEFFELGIHFLNEKLIDYITEGNMYFLSVFQNGKILYEVDPILEEYRKEVITYYQMIKERKKIDNTFLQTASFLYDEFYRAMQEDSIIINTVYYQTLHTIREVYHRKRGYTKSLEATKIPFLYTNEKQAKNYCVTLPNSFYKDLFLNTLTTKKSKEENIEALWKEAGINKIEVYNHFKTIKRRPLERRQIKEKLIFLYNIKRQIEKTKQVIPTYYDYAYHLFLKDAQQFYFDYKSIPFQSQSPYENYEYMKKEWECPFTRIYEKSLTAHSIEEKSYYVEKIMQYLGQIDSINPKEYYIKY